MKKITDCQEFISELKIAINNKNKRRLLILDDLNGVDWDDVPDFIFEEYNNLLDEANEIFYS